MSTEETNRLDAKGQKERLKDLATALGFVEIEVQLRSYHLDVADKPAVRSENVKVLQLPIKQYRKMASLLEDEIGLVALYCGKLLPGGGLDNAWAEQLTPASHQKVIEIGREINWDFFSSWVSRTRQTREALKGLPGAGGMEETARIFDVIAKHNPELVKELISNVAGSINNPSTSNASAAEKTKT